MKWPRFKDIFSLRPTDIGELASIADGHGYQSHSQKIKFDNTIRVWIAIPSYLACYFLWIHGAIASLIPMTLLFLIYGTVQFLATWLFMDSRHKRKLDFGFGLIDLIGMSLSVHFTGGTNSPLYFVYFIPLIVHAFHRDLGMVVLSGFGGVVLYGFAVWNSFIEMTPALMTNLGARLFFMLLTVSVACLAITILRKQDSVDHRRIRRLKNLTLVSETLNQMTSMNELQDISTTLIQLINQGLGDTVKPWTRFLFVQKDAALMRAIADPNNGRTDLQHEISTISCPAMKANAPFLLDDSGKDPECPTEKFSFRSHLCLPVSGAENESFGVLFAGSPIPHVFLTEEVQFLEFVAKSLGLSIQRLNRMEELRKSLEMNSWVMAATIASSRSADETFTAVLDGVLSILRADMVSLSLFQSATGQLKTVKVHGGETPENRSLMMPLKTIKGEPLGVIKVARREATDKFSAIEVETAATFAMRAALAIENALAHQSQREQIQSFMDGSSREKAA